MLRSINLKTDNVSFTLCFMPSSLSSPVCLPYLLVYTILALTYTHILNPLLHLQSEANTYSFKYFHPILSNITSRVPHIQKLLGIVILSKLLLSSVAQSTVNVSHSCDGARSIPAFAFFFYLFYWHLPSLKLVTLPLSLICPSSTAWSCSQSGISFKVINFHVIFCCLSVLTHKENH